MALAFGIKVVITVALSGQCRVLLRLWLVPDFSLLASNRLALLQAGVLPQSLQSLDGIPQHLPYWLDGVSVGTDTQSYEYFSLCYDDPAPGQR